MNFVGLWFCLKISKSIELVNRLIFYFISPLPFPAVSYFSQRYLKAFDLDQAQQRRVSLSNRLTV
jgi:hypothetical protein